MLIVELLGAGRYATVERLLAAGTRRRCNHMVLSRQLQALQVLIQGSHLCRLSFLLSCPNCVELPRCFCTMARCCMGLGLLGSSANVLTNSDPSAPAAPGHQEPALPLLPRRQNRARGAHWRKWRLRAAETGGHYHLANQRRLVDLKFQRKQTSARFQQHLLLAIGPSCSYGLRPWLMVVAAAGGSEAWLRGICDGLAIARCLAALASRRAAPA